MTVTISIRKKNMANKKFGNEDKSRKLSSMVINVSVVLTFD